VKNFVVEIAGLCIVAVVLFAGVYSSTGWILNVELRSLERQSSQWKGEGNEDVVAWNGNRRARWTNQDFYRWFLPEIEDWGMTYHAGRCLNFFVEPAVRILGWVK